MNRTVRLPLWALLCGVFIATVEGFGLLAWLLSSTVVVNTTDSMPEGLYLRNLFASQIQRGSLVTFCPPADALARAARVGDIPPHGICATGTVPFLKRVVATAGDIVSLSEASVAVNGQQIPKSALQRARSMRVLRAVKPGTYVVPAGSAWVISDSIDGYDSRYYGPITPRFVVVPVYLWKAASQ